MNRYFDRLVLIEGRVFKLLGSARSQSELDLLVQNHCIQGREYAFVVLHGKRLEPPRAVGMYERLKDVKEVTETNTYYSLTVAGWKKRKLIFWREEKV